MLADPVFAKSDPRVNVLGEGPDAPAGSVESIPAHLRLPNGSRTVYAASLPRLLSTRWEAQQIAQFVPKGESMLAFDFTADRATAMSPELGQYRIIHFATHAIINNTHPELSGIALSFFRRDGTPQDGFLRMDEIFNLSLPSELVVLSACETGLGKEVEGEGVIGLTRGFMYAGTKRVAVSLWNIDDRATAELMVKFYRNMLKDGMSPASALRAAQVEMWNDKRWRQPYYWAGFILQGEWK